MSARRPKSDRYTRIYAVVRRIPRGRVATYGQVAELAGLPGCARQVGYAMHALCEEDNVPWQRVVNAQGRVSLRREEYGDVVQQKLLESEGIVFDATGRLELARLRWQPRLRSTGASARVGPKGKKAKPKRRAAPAATRASARQGRAVI